MAIGRILGGQGLLNNRGPDRESLRQPQETVEGYARRIQQAKATQRVQNRADSREVGRQETDPSIAVLMRQVLEMQARLEDMEGRLEEAEQNSFKAEHFAREDFDPTPPPDFIWGELTSSAAPYDWKEKEWDAGGGALQDRSGGRTGTANARYVGGNDPDLQSGLIVRLYATEDDAFGILYVFDVPLQLDSSFVHRATAGGSPTLGNRADFTRAVDATSTGSAFKWDVTSQATKVGYVKTQILGIDIDTAANAVIDVYWEDQEFDVLGRHVSSSDVFTTEIHAPVVC